MADNLFRRLMRAVPRSVWVPSVAVGSVAAILVTLAVLATPAPSAPSPGAQRPGPQVPQTLPAIRPVAKLLAPYTSCADLLAGLRAHTAAHVGPYGMPGQGYGYAMGNEKMAPYPMPAEGAAALSSAPTANGTSTTNVQEIGVDEPDIVKTDQGRVVAITQGSLRVIDAATRTVVGTLDLSLYDGWQSAQLLVSGNAALIILGGAGYSGPMMGAVAYPMRPYAVPAAKSTVLFVNLTGTPRVTGSLRVTGSYLDARMVGSIARVVVDSAPTLTLPAPSGNGSTTSDAANLAANRLAVRHAPLSAWLPSYTVTSGAVSHTTQVPCASVSHPADYTGASMITVYTLDLGHLDADPQPVSIAADGDTVYASSGSLYVASNPDWICCYEGGVAVSGPVPAVPVQGAPIAPNASGAAGVASAPIVPVPVSPPPQLTQIHRFDISGSGAPVYLGSGQVSGRLLNSYSLSEFDGYLRVATTSDGYSGTYSGTQSSAVTVLDAKKLTVTGTIGGLGKGEQLYAVRFEGPLGYVVTFQQTDPLYVLDLSNPAAPRAVGTLSLTGFSDYLHDVGNGRVLGVGQEANVEGRVAGLQLSLFDVHDPAKPQRTGHLVRADAPGESQLDPHAFLFWAPTGLVVVPVQSWQPTESGKVLVARISGDQIVGVGLLANPRAAGAADDGLGIQRSMIVGGMLWTLSSNGMQISDPATLGRRAWIPFS